MGVEKAGLVAATGRDRSVSGRLRSLCEVASRLHTHASESGVAFAAAGIAYYAQVSLIPLGVLVFVAVSTVAGDELAVRLVDTAGDALSPTGRRLLRDAVAGRAGRWEATVAGVVVLGWGSLRFFRGLKSAVTEVYDGREGIFVRWRDSAVAGLAILLSLTAVLGAGFAFRRFGVGPPVAVRPLLLAAALAASLYPVYYVLPDVDVTPAEALPGTVLTAGGWVVLHTAFRTYVSFVGGTAYGVLGGVILLVTWLYLASLFLVIGAVLNVVLAGRDRGA